MSSEELNHILELLKSIDKRLTVLEDNLSGVEKSCKKMNNHIEFVEDTYEIVRTPLNFMKNRIEYIMGAKSKTELPKLIENNYIV
jgi:archaellum component FlaC